MAQQVKEEGETLSEVNVIPLADLSLVLLIILMVLSPLVQQAIIQVSSAKATAAQTQEELPSPIPETPMIVSYEPGILKINGTVTGKYIDMEFVKQFDAVMFKRHDKSVNLTAAPNLSHGEVVHLMDIVQRHGASELVMLKWDPSAGALAAAPAPSQGAHS